MTGLRSISLQLYSVRDALEQDAQATIDRIASIGYTQVEASYRTLSASPRLGAAIRGAGLTSPTMTGTLVGADRAPVFDTAKELGAYAVIDTLVREEHWTAEADIARTADELNAAASEAAAYALTVGYHNHWWELLHSFSGRTGLDLLADALDPAVVLEVDAYWVAVGGQDVVPFVARLGDRIRFLHVKDGPVNRENKQQQPAGQGSLPIWDIVAALPELQIGVVEFDDYAGDMFGAIAESLSYLSAGSTR
ncbi:MAG TPA: sugar phosphate isomerase/epimerase [Trebonia sp.]